MTFALCGIFLLLTALFISKGVVPERAITMLCIAACAISAWFGGRFAAKRGSGFPALCALAAGVVFCLLVFITGLVVSGGMRLTGSNLVMLLAALAATLIAGVVGNARGKKAKKTTKSKKRK